jgi:hypothetical protein
VRGRYTESREGARGIASLYSWIYIAVLEPGICQPAATSRQNCQPAGNISLTNWNLELCHIKNLLPRFKHSRRTFTDTISWSFAICYLRSYSTVRLPISMCPASSPARSYCTRLYTPTQPLPRNLRLRVLQGTKTLHIPRLLSILSHSCPSHSVNHCLYPVYTLPASLHISWYLHCPTLHTK